MKCKWYLCNNETKINTQWCSRNCSVKASVTRLRHERKKRAVELKGGKCELCGYNKCLRALTFHHPDPNIKNFSISDNHVKNWEKLKEEILKCRLLCSNCHA